MTRLVASTDRGAALERGERLREFLIEMGVPPNAEVMEDSGCGCYVLIRVDERNDESTLALFTSVVAAWDALFSDDEVKLDTTVVNAARLIRIPGTLNGKGDATADRPHRPARLLDAPNALETCPRGVLERIAALAPGPERKSQATGSGLEVAREKVWGQATLYELESCPWNPDHHRTAHIVQFDSGPPL